MSNVNKQTSLLVLCGAAVIASVYLLASSSSSPSSLSGDGSKSIDQDEAIKAGENQISSNQNAEKTPATKNPVIATKKHKKSPTPTPQSIGNLATTAKDDVDATEGKEVVFAEESNKAVAASSVADQADADKPPAEAVPETDTGMEQTSQDIDIGDENQEPATAATSTNRTNAESTAIASEEDSPSPSSKRRNNKKKNGNSKGTISIKSIDEDSTATAPDVSAILKAKKNANSGKNHRHKKSIAATAAIRELKSSQGGGKKKKNKQKQ